MSNQDAEFYTPQEAAELLKVHINTIRNMMKDGRIEYYDVGKAKRISRDAIEALKHQYK